MSIEPIRRGRWLALLVLSLAVSGCDFLDPDPWREDRRAMEQNLSRWTNAGVRAYDYTLSMGCFCGASSVGPVEITVNEGVITSLARASTDDPVPEELWSGFPTVEQLFDRIGNALGRYPASFEARYDPTLGHPTSITIDFDERVADDEFSYVVTGLRMVEVP